jgi:hypothetical protein
MTMTTGGTGLGLFIARELTRAMGGEIEAANAPRRGPTFTVRLPLETAGEPAGQPAPPRRGRVRPGPGSVLPARRPDGPAPTTLVPLLLTLARR